MRRVQGFTLIELLVVIAVIAILMAILVPVLGRARDQAYTIVCRSNLKGYGMGLRMYLDDNDSRLPLSGRYMKSELNDWVHKGEEPEGSFWPYVKDLDAHMCSKFSKLVKNDVTFGDTAVSYVMNSYVGENRIIRPNWLGPDVVGVVFETEVYNPSRVMVFTEENTWTIQDYSMFPFNSTHFTVGNWRRQIDNYATFHNTGDLNWGGTNCVFVDGHVDLWKREDDSDYQLEQGFRLAWPRKELPY